MRKKHTLYSAIILLLLLRLLPAEEEGASKKVETITITAEKSDPGEEAPSAHSTIITKEEIEASGSISLEEILAPALGLQISRQGGAGEASYISIRGASPEQVVILINGRRLNSAQGGGVDLSSIDVGTIERIEIYRGGNSSLFGPNAVGGVVNIVTRAPEEGAFNGDTAVTAGSYNTYTGHINVHGRTENNRFGYFLGLGGLYTAGDYLFEDSRSSDGTAARENAEAREYSYSATLEAALSESMHLSTDFRGFGSRRGAPGILEFPTPDAEITESRHDGSLSLRFSGDRGRIALESGLSRHDRRYTDPEYFSGAVDDRHVNMMYSAQITLEEPEKWRESAYRLGYSLTGEELDSSAVVLDDGVSEGDRDIARMLHSIFASGKFGRQWFTESHFTPEFHPSLRLDIQRGPAKNEYKMFFSYNAGGVFPILSREKLTLKANIGTSYRIPGFNDLFWPSSSFATGNPALQEEEAFIWDAGIKIRPLPSLSAELVYYRHTVTNLIIWTPGAGGRWRPDNTQDARIQGVETELRYLLDMPRFSSFAELQLNAHFMDPRDITRGSTTYNKILPRRSRYTANGVITLSRYSGHSLRIEGRYKGRSYSTAMNTKSLDPYLILNASLLYKLSPAWSATVTVENILNREYADQREYPVPGIEVRISAGVRF